MPINKDTPTPARCLTCDYGADGMWKPWPGNVYRGHGCPACARVALLTPEEHHRRAALVGIQWLADPANNRTPTPARCLTCGYEWKPRPEHVSMGKGCPACAGILPLTAEEHHRRAAAVGIEWLRVPAHALAPTPARCLTCGYGADGTWKTRSNDVQRGKGCPACASILPLTAEEYDRRAALVGITWLEQPTTSHGPTPARCLTCGHGEDGTWKPWTNAVYRGQGCPVCADYGFDPAARPSCTSLSAMPAPLRSSA